MDVTLKADFIVIGGGCVGLSVAYSLLKRYPGKKVFVLEKEPTISYHQTGRNSGVIHSGIYYKPGSLKAINCRRGKAALEQFCKENYVDFEKCGKLIVATDYKEEDRLYDIFIRGKENGVDCHLLTKSEMLKIEPNVSGVAAIHVPETGIVNYNFVCFAIEKRIADLGGNVHRYRKVTVIEKGSTINVTTNDGFHDIKYQCDALINCAGVYADQVARIAGHDPELKIIPFKGEYYTLSSQAKSLVKGLIYPVPDPQFPFLGVHFTKMIGGDVECGPNAVLALGRESYDNKINFSELWETLTYPGFWRLAFKYWKTGFMEILRSSSKMLYARELTKLVPAIKQRHLVNDRAPGIRAQAVLKDGTLVDDFKIKVFDNIVHVLNAPSPAATACLSIGEHIVTRLG